MTLLTRCYSDAPVVFTRVLTVSQKIILIFILLLTVFIFIIFIVMDQFEVLRQVGQGAFGRALLVKQRHGHAQLYVIKEINLRQLSSRDKDASRKEVTLLSKMKHPNIVAFYKSFYDRNNFYILMEYCDSGDLMKRIRMQRGKPFTEQQIVDWFVQICLGLKHIHDRKVLHRDIKAQNIFLTQGGLKVKLGDFGIAKMLNSTVELARTCVGTPYYLSPEICENRPYNNKTDIWSLGCILYELCTLRHPFEGSNLKQLVLRICRGRYSPVSQRYSSELHLLLHLLFKVSPRDRPSANSLLKRPLLQQQISRHLDTQLLQEEFSHTVLHRHTPAAPEASNNTDQVCRDPVECNPVLRAAVNPAQRRAADRAPHMNPAVGVERRRIEPLEPDQSQHRAAALEPYKLVAQARDEYLQRRHEAHQYKLRAQKQLGLRPSTADTEDPQSNPQEHHGNIRAAQDRRQRGQEEYLKQLQRIREQYHHDVRCMRPRAELQETHTLKKNRERHTHGKPQQRGIMFEIKLSDEETKTEEDEESEDEPLNHTLTFAQGEKLRNQLQGSEVRQEVEEEVVKRAEWCRDAAETFLNALENMDVMTESSTSLAQTEEQQEVNRKHWTNRLPETLLNALSQADIMDCSTETLVSSEEECDEDEVEEDEERLEPRSDDEDTNFEESEDELSDSMRNLLTTQEQEQEVNRRSQEVREETQPPTHDESAAN
ncbi:serine/threonine-protein kinase Nek5 isoform X1 [Carassius auratus]|uniref:non-specific serine/threonine protein kinase n=1 Tax=Carassius auratus TaxID=7957 RepID=A0A6P6KLZ8_CARAU|nr:serine/threonine-protein kinase Nek5-like isoform X1 [Carassius auratus]